MESCGLWSTFTLPTLILPSYSFDNSSITGPMARQGPHHSAQKSTTVNLSEEITLSWKLVSVNSKAIISVFYVSCLFLYLQMSGMFSTYLVGSMTSGSFVYIPGRLQ